MRLFFLELTNEAHLFVELKSVFDNASAAWAQLFKQSFQEGD